MKSRTEEEDSKATRVRGMDMVRGNRDSGDPPPEGGQDMRERAGCKDTVRRAA